MTAFALPASAPVTTRAAADLAAGKPIVLHDGEQGIATLVFAAATASPQLVTFAVRHGSGLLVVALPEPDCDRLGLPRMIGGHHGATMGDARVTVDAADGIGTGISATDRALTIRLLGKPGSGPDTFRRPGHVMTVAVPSPAACECACTARPSMAAVAVEAVRDAGLYPATAFTHLVRPDTAEVLDHHDAVRFGRDHQLLVADLREIPGENTTSPSLLTCEDSIS